MDCEQNVQHFWELALASYEVSPEVSKSALRTCLEIMRESDQDIPQEWKKMFCMKCFNLFYHGYNCKVNINSNKKHPNLKIIEYHCLGCGNVQRINSTRSKQEAVPEPQEVKQDLDSYLQLSASRNQQKKRKLMMDLFS